MKERFRNILGKRGRKWGGLALALVLLGNASSRSPISSVGSISLGRSSPIIMGDPASGLTRST